MFTRISRLVSGASPRNLDRATNRTPDQAQARNAQSLNKSATSAASDVGRPEVHHAQANASPGRIVEHRSPEVAMQVALQGRGNSKSFQGQMSEYAALSPERLPPTASQLFSGPPGLQAAATAARSPAIHHGSASQLTFQALGEMVAGRSPFIDRALPETPGPSTDELHATADNPDVIYATADDPDGVHATADDPDGNYATVDDPDGNYATVDDPDGNYATADDPDGNYATVGDPDGLYATADDPDVIYATADNPDGGDYEIPVGYRREGPPPPSQERPGVAPNAGNGQMNISEGNYTPMVPDSGQVNVGENSEYQRVGPRDEESAYERVRPREGAGGNNSAEALNGQGAGATNGQANVSEESEYQRVGPRDAESEYERVRPREGAGGNNSAEALNGQGAGATNGQVNVSEENYTSMVPDSGQVNVSEDNYTSMVPDSGQVNVSEDNYTSMVPDSGQVNVSEDNYTSMVPDSGQVNVSEDNYTSMDPDSGQVNDEDNYTSMAPR